MNLFKTGKTDYEKMVQLVQINGLMILLTIFLDYYKLQVVNNLFHHVLIKLAFISLPFIALQFYRFEKIKDWVPLLLYICVFSYSSFFVLNYHFSYYMAFLHYLIVTPIFINIKKKPFLYANVIALIIVVVTSINIPNVDITGREISAEIINSYALLFFVVVIWYMGVLTQRQKEEDNNKVFSELGKVSSFLLHELSSPVSRLANKASNSEEHSREIDQIKNLLQLTKAISQKRSEIKKDEFKLSTLSNYYIDEYSRTIDRLDIEVDVEERNRVVNSNATFVDIIVKNIIKNAIEHLKTLESNNKKIVIREISDEKKEVLRISNTAEKKSKKEINEMFSPLYSTKKTKYGSNQGIGLFISKRMAEGLGININCFCKDDLIHFDVEFPLS